MLFAAGWWRLFKTDRVTWGLSAGILLFVFAISQSLAAYELLVGAGLLLFVLTKWVKRLMHGVP